MNIIIRISAAVILMVLLAGAGGWAYEAQAEDGAVRAYPPHGLMIEVDGLRMRLDCEGSGSPVVVFDSGWPDTGLVWQKVQAQVAKTTRACSYDRAGLGWSDPLPGGAALTSADAALRLYQLLQSAGEQGPFILVGHSLGGANARMFAQAYPQVTAGLVLVDPATLEDFAAQPPAFAEMNASNLSALSWAARLAPVGLHRLFLPGGFTHSALPEALAPASRAITSRAQSIQTAYRERLGVEESLRQAGAAAPGALGGLPLVVLISSQTVTPDDVPGSFPVEAANQAHLQALQLLAPTSSQGRQVITDQSDHYIHLREPELVVEAILSILH